MRLEEPLSRKIPSTSVAKKVQYAGPDPNVDSDKGARTFLFQEHSTLGDYYWHIPVDEALSLLVGERYGHVRIPYADLKRYTEDSRRFIC